MDVQLMIDDFIEGVLNPEKELELFHILSSNPELVSDLKQLMALKMSIAEDISDHGPHPESINSITDQLGFNSSKPGFFTRYRQSFITSGIAGVILLLLQFNPFNSSMDNGSKELTSSSVPVRSDLASSNNLNSNNESVNYIYDTVYIEKERVVFINENKNITQEETHQKEVIIDDDYITKPFNSGVINTPIVESITSNTSSVTTPIYFNTKSSVPKNTNHLIETSFTGFMNISEIKQVNRDYQTLNNFNFTYLYKLEDQYFIGIDYTRENFYQSFFTVDNEQAFQYFQNPDFNTISALFRYYLDFKIFENQDYYLQFDLGLPVNENFNFSGLSNRLSFGVQHEITSSFYLKSNVNYSTLFFRQNNLIYDTSKFGFNIGAGFKL